MEDGDTRMEGIGHGTPTRDKHGTPHSAPRENTRPSNHPHTHDAHTHEHRYTPAAPDTTPTTGDLQDEGQGAALVHARVAPLGNACGMHLFGHRTNDLKPRAFRMFKGHKAAVDGCA